MEKGDRWESKKATNGDREMPEMPTAPAKDTAELQSPAPVT